MGKPLSVGVPDKTIKLWNLHTGELRRTLTGHLAEVLSVAISPDGQIIVSGSVDTTIKQWHLHTGALKKNPPRAFKID
jgi:WD40 repeat protein